MPDISVVTICYNDLEQLKKTCSSVDAQIIKPAEHWIINASTKNDIADWLTATPQPGYRKWANVKDEGIAGSFNQGIKRAEAEVIHLLNAGDVYASDDVLKEVMNFFAINKEAQWISGKLKVRRSGHWIEIGKPFEKIKLYRGMRSVSHPSWFVKKQIYEKCGEYNATYKIAMDYDMMCRIADEPYRFMDKTIVEFDDSGISTVKYLDSLKENNKAYESYFGFSILSRLWQFRLKLLHKLLQTSAGKTLFNLKKKMGLENM